MPIRLYGGEQESEGTVEILYQGRWGTICDIFWSSADAAVVCHQLGYEGRHLFIVIFKFSFFLSTLQELCEHHVDQNLVTVDWA